MMRCPACGVEKDDSEFKSDNPCRPCGAAKAKARRLAAKGTVLTQEQLKMLIAYDPELGTFHWKATGERAGFANSGGYHLINIGAKDYRASRLAWLYMTGTHPKEEMDHINRNQADDRFCNLREATRQQNCVNRNGRDGLPLGITRDGNGWRAQIRIRGRYMSLGNYPSAELAAMVYRDASLRLHGEFSPFATPAPSPADKEGK